MKDNWNEKRINFCKKILIKLLRQNLYNFLKTKKSVEKMDTSAIDFFIDKYNAEIEDLKIKISSVENSEDEFHLLQKIAESYYILLEQYKLRRNLTKNLIDYEKMLAKFRT